MELGRRRFIRFSLVVCFGTPALWVAERFGLRRVVEAVRGSFYPGGRKGMAAAEVQKQGPWAG